MPTDHDYKDAADRRESMMRVDLARVLVGLLGLVDRQLGSRVGLETLVGNRPTTHDRSAERPRVESRLSSSEGRQPVPKFSGNGIVGVLGGEQLGGVTGTVAGTTCFSV